VYAVTDFNGKAFFGRTQKVSMKKGQADVQQALPSMKFDLTGKKPAQLLAVELK
jgi:hypothetical protein